MLKLGNEVMMTKFSKFCTGLALAGVLGWSSAHAQSTGQVYQLTFSGSGVQQQNVSSNQQTVAKVTVTTANLINTALGLPVNNVVPTNQVLALILNFGSSTNGEPNGNIVVWDTNSKTVLANFLTTQFAGGALASPKGASISGSGYIAMMGTISKVGNFTDGWLATTGTATANNPNEEGGATPIIVKFSGSAVQGELIGNDGSSGFDILITKGKLTLSGQIGSIITS